MKLMKIMNRLNNVSQSNLLFSRRMKMCTTNPCNSKMEDWQYVFSINQSLKKGDINQAIKFLIQSHLSGRILDMQIFRNIHLKMLDLKAELSYHELAYKIYREYFQPHLLMQNWMNMLARSSDLKIQQILVQDYKALGLQIPDDESKEAQNLQKQQGQKIKQKEKGLQNQSKKINLHKNITLNTSNGIQVKKIIQNLLGMNTKISLHGIQIIYDDFYDEENEEEEENKLYQNEEAHNQEDPHNGSQQNLDDDEDNMGSQPFMTRIKIERIDINKNQKQ